MEQVKLNQTMALPQVRPPSSRTEQSLFWFSRYLLYLPVVGILFAINAFGDWGNLVCYIILTGMALTSTAGAIKALALSGLIIMANPFLVDQTIVLTFARFVPLLAGGARVIYDLHKQGSGLFSSSHLKALLVFAIVASVLSIITQYYTIISLLKICVFSCGAWTLLAGAQVRELSRRDLCAWILAILTLIIVGGIITYSLGISHVIKNDLFDRSGVIGFSGIASHPQTMGVIGAIAALFCVALFLSERGMAWPIYIGLAGVLLVMSFMSQARTGIFGFALAACTLLFLGLVYRRALNPRAVWATMIIGLGSLAMVGGALVTGGANSGIIGEFVAKRDTAAQASFDLDYLFKSRIPFIEFSWQNFKDNPVTGIGFGTAYSADFVHNATTLSAPVEKTFLPTGILEEVGVVGTLAFSVFLFLLYRNLLRERNVLGAAVLSGFLFLNLGEMVVFSFGGGWYVLLGHRRFRDSDRTTEHVCHGAG